MRKSVTCAGSAEARRTDVHVEVEMMTTKKMGRRGTFTEAENEKLRQVAKDLIAAYGSQTALAAALGPEFPQPALSAFLLEKYGAGLGLARKLAELRDTTLEKLLGRPGSGEHQAVDRYPHRAMVLDCARRLGISVEARAELASMRLVDREDAPVFWWLEQLVALESRLRDSIRAVKLSVKR